MTWSGTLGSHVVDNQSCLRFPRSSYQWARRGLVVDHRVDGVDVDRRVVRALSPTAVGRTGRHMDTVRYTIDWGGWSEEYTVVRRLRHVCEVD